MEKTKKILVALLMVLGVSSLGMSQTTGEQQRAIQKARSAASDCINKPDYAGLQTSYQVTTTSICDFLPGPIGNAAIFGYHVDIYVEGHCPGNIRELCDPYFAKIATVFVSCGNQEVEELICY